MIKEENTDSVVFPHTDIGRCVCMCGPDPTRIVVFQPFGLSSRMDQTTQAQQDAIDFIENTMMPFCSKYQMTDSSGRSFYASSMYNVFGQGVDYFKLIQFEREVMNFHEERNQSNVNEIGRDLFQEILVESPTVFLFALLDTANDNPTFAHRFILIAWPQSPKSMLIHSFEHPEHSELNFTPRATLVEHANWIQTLKIFVEGDMFDTNRKQD